MNTQTTPQSIEKDLLLLAKSFAQKVKGYRNLNEYELSERYIENFIDMLDCIYLNNEAITDVIYTKVNVAFDILCK